MNPPQRGLQQLQQRISGYLAAGETLDEAIAHAEGALGQFPPALLAEAADMAQMAARALASPKQSIKRATIASLMGGKAVAPAMTSVLYEFVYRIGDDVATEERRMRWLTVSTAMTMEQLQSFAEEACDEGRGATIGDEAPPCVGTRIRGGFGFVVQPPV